MKWTIKRKLYLGFGLALFMMSASTCISRWAQARAHETQAEVGNSALLLKDLEHLDGYVNHVTALQRAYLISGDESIVAPIPALRDDANKTVDEIMSLVRSDADQKAGILRWKQEVTDRRAFVNELLDTRKNKGADAAKVLFNTGEDNFLYGKMQTELNGVHERAVETMTRLQSANESLQREAVLIQWAALAIGFIVMAVIATTLARSIHRNVSISVETLQTIANKDLTGADAEPASQDELADAIAAVNHVKRALIEALSEVSLSSAQVASAGTEIEATSDEMSETTRNEQKNMTQFASALAEMNATVKEVAENAERASQAATDAVASANSGRTMVQHTHTAMGKIRESVSAASTDISSLGEITRSIGEVVRIIQDIAEQTNLLALNAAIEAARAGEQGKGFAVVAQEVRQLAERTAKFTNEIADKVNSVQQGAERAVRSMQQGETVVNEGVRQFDEVAGALETIVQRIESAQQGVSMIATATTQQSAATGELTASIHGISNEVDRTVQQVDQTAIACAELAQQAASMQRLVDTFHLPPQSRTAQRSPLTRAA
jgi:methyl-accepting chemotaxis protein